MTNKLPCRLRAALVVAGCLVPAMALAQLEPHFHPQSRTPQRSDIEYGSRTITLPMMQRPPSPAGAPGAPTGAPGTVEGGGPFAPGGAPGASPSPGPGPGGPPSPGTGPGAGPGAGPGPGPGSPGPGAGPGAAPGGPPTPKGPGGGPAAGPGGPPSPKGGPAAGPGGPPSPKGPVAGPSGGPNGGPPKPTAPGEDQPPSAQQQAGGGCEPHSPLPSGIPGGPGSGTAVYQQFPPSGPMRTAWFVTFDHAVHRGLFITSAFFKPGPDKPWVKVLSDAGPSEIFVPYQSGDPRYLDLAHPSEGGAGEFGLIRASQRDAGRCGQVIGRGNAVVRELTEKGVLWKMNALVYRGHKMTLWGTLGSGNYNYMLSYAFNDDGMIEFRGGATATNLPSKPFEAHMHNIIWRVNVDLNGAKNSVSVVRHIENTNAPTWRDIVEPFNNNREGSIELNPREFTMLHVMSQNLKNSRGSQGGYMIMPFYRGTARHMESWMRKDVWVTRYKPQEIGFQFIERYANNEPIANEDVVIWLVTSSLHIARDEDGMIYRRQGQPARFIGAAVTMWAGFDMKPHNIMDNTPFFPEIK